MNHQVILIDGEKLYSVSEKKKTLLPGEVRDNDNGTYSLLDAKGKDFLTIKPGFYYAELSGDNYDQLTLSGEEIYMTRCFEFWKH